MTTVKTKDRAEIYYKDWGAGQPVVFSHGWPLSSEASQAKCFSSHSTVIESPPVTEATGAQTSPHPATI